MSFQGDLSFQPVRPQSRCKRLAVVVLQTTLVALVITVAVFYMRTFRYGASLARRDRDVAFLRGGDAASCRRGISTKNRINALISLREAHLVDLSREGSNELDSRGVQNLDTLEWDTNAQMRALLSQVMCKTALGVMASSVKKERSLAQSETWMAHFHRSRTVIMSDKSELDLNIRAVPLYNESSKACAQQRSIESVLSAYKENPEAEYIIGIDDDTFVNLFALARILARFPVHQAAMGGYIVEGRTDGDNLMNIDPTKSKAADQGNVTKKGTMSPFAWPWGGAGMIFNRKAVAAFSEAFRTGVCQRTGNNDIVFALADGP
jgi:hypothetical protein